MADWEDMITGLEGALCNYRKDNHSGTAEALVAVLRYLRPRVDDRLTTPLYALLSDLAASERKQNREKPIKPALDEARASAAIDLLMKCGDRLDVAASKVARATGGKITTEQLKELRRNIRRRRARDASQKHYWEYLEAAQRAATQRPAQEIAARALKDVRAKFAADANG